MKPLIGVVVVLVVIMALVLSSAVMNTPEVKKCYAEGGFVKNGLCYAPGGPRLIF